MKNTQTLPARATHAYNKVLEELKMMGLSEKYLKERFKPILDESIESAVEAMLHKEMKKYE